MGVAARAGLHEELLPALGHLHAVLAAKARELPRAIQAEPVVLDGRRMKVRVAFGVHSFAAGERAKEALAAADRAMYLRKSSTTSPALRRRGRV